MRDIARSLSFCLFGVAFLACAEPQEREPFLPNAEHVGENHKIGTDVMRHSPKEEQEMEESRNKAEAAIAVYRTRDWAKAQQLLLQSALDLDTSEQNLKLKVLSLAARSFTLLGDVEGGEETLERARGLLEGADDEIVALFGVVEGIFIRERGNKAAALAHFSELAEFCKERDLWEKAVDAIHHAAIVAPAEEQEKWALAGIRAAEKGGEATEKWLPALWNNLGWTYDGLGQHEKALHALEQARDAHYAKGNEYSQNAADAHVAHALIQLGRLDEAEVLVAKSRKGAEAALAKTPEDFHWKERIYYCDWKEGEILGARGKHKEALVLLKKTFAFFQSENGQGWYDEWLELIEASAQASGGTAKE